MPTIDLAKVLLTHGEQPNTDRFTSDSMEAVETQCERCKRMLVRNTTCEAYPEGIPNEIVSGAVDHSKPYTGDNDLTFLPLG